MSCDLIRWSEPLRDMLAALTSSPYLSSSEKRTETSRGLDLLHDRKDLTKKHSQVARQGTEGVESSRYPRLYSPWLDTSTTSPANLTLARLWLSNCLQNHKPCRIGPQISMLPQ